MERSTRQRRAILHALAQSGRPLRPIEILELGQKEVPGLGLTTVYRNIRQMTADGSLVRVYYPGQPALFELPTGKFLPHFICRSCQQVYYFEEEALMFLTIHLLISESRVRKWCFTDIVQTAHSNCPRFLLA